MEHDAFIGTNLDIATSLLTQGEAVAIPTETVYGLAANALNPRAVTKIFAIKARPTFDPLIVHLADFNQVLTYVMAVPPVLQSLAAAFMPGPLTLLLQKRDCIPDLVTAGSEYVAIRVPAHPMARALLSRLEFPLAAPSANPFGYISPTTARHVADQLGDKVSYILDGGPCQVGLESTIVSLTESGEVVVLRKGGISVEQLEEVVGGVHVQTHSSSTPAAPGMLTSHYAPKIPLVLGIEPTALQQYLPERIGIISFSQPIDGIPKENQVVLSHTGNMEEAARNLFSGMRYLDGCPLDIIFAEEVPPHHLGLAINDRLHRAAADRTTPHA